MAKLEKSLTISASTVAQIQSIEADVKAASKRAIDAEEARKSSEEGLKAVEAELAKLRAEVAATKKANQAIPDDHDYGEAETRDAFIDLLLHEAGWPLDQPRDREFPVKGMPNQSGDGFVDYVLWGDDGKPLAVIEAKRTKKDSRTGQQQAKLYADCLEAQYGRRPVMFTTNGYEHWLWDDAQYPPRPVSGFMKKDEFVIFDFCQNLEFFSENPNFTDGVGTKPMGERLFRTRVELIDAAQEDDNPHEDLVRSIKQRLQDEVAGMPLDNFIVRAKRRSVERFQKPDSWSDLSLEARMALTDDVAGLPSAFEDGALPAK